MFSHNFLVKITDILLLERRQIDPKKVFVAFASIFAAILAPLREYWNGAVETKSWQEGKYFPPYSALLNNSNYSIPQHETYDTFFSIKITFFNKVLGNFIDLLREKNF